MVFVNDDNRVRCPQCRIIAIKLISVTDDGKGKRVCRHCKKKILGKKLKTRIVKFKLLKEDIKMAMTKQLKISEMSLDRLQAYAENYKLMAPGGVTESEKREFYISELQKLNEGKDNVGASIDAGKYKGVNSCKCSVCGEEKAVRAEVYAKRVEKFGSEEKLTAGYKCMECRRKEK
ncbi:hypothetical protein LCGC14_0694450 [marine sediment metagenome]|uniref:Uncharacterized protein n=1 Tax=marine sediment metagenome TaxID=412755 RepID=A0A0F9TSJ9_9ZZZZ